MAGSSSGEATYSSTARRFHWWTVVLVATGIPLGLYMTYRGNTLNIKDGLTNTLYNSHKVVGIIILVLVVARLIYRLTHGAPPDEPSLEPWQKGASHATHWMLYLLLLVVPIGGYIGISLFPSARHFRSDLAAWAGLARGSGCGIGGVFSWHWLGAVVIVILVGVHVGAALFHYVIRKDGVLRRMLPAAGKRS